MKAEPPMTSLAQAIFLGAGFSCAAGLPATSALMDGKVSVTSHRLARRLSSVLDSWTLWRDEQASDDVAEFLHAAYTGQVPDGSAGILPDSSLPWRWVAQYLAVRLAEHVAGSPVGNDPRYFEQIMLGTKVLAHRNLFREVAAAGPVVGVVTSNYDVLAERAIRHTAVRGWPIRGFHYGGLPVPQFAGGRGLLFRRQFEQLQSIGLDGEVPLCKLHGSLNWERRVSLDRGELQYQMHLSQDLRYAYRLDAEPAIVAPIPEAEPSPWLEPVWASARAVLAQADNWTLVGYSLPAYDMAIRGLMREAWHGQSIVIRDLGPEPILERMRRLIPGAVIIPGEPI
jgi:hypothetical protein